MTPSDKPTTGVPYPWPDGKGHELEVTARLAVRIEHEDLDRVCDRLEPFRRGGDIADISFVLSSDGRTLTFATAVERDDAADARALAVRCLGDALVATGVVSSWSGLPAPRSTDTALVA